MEATHEAIPSPRQHVNLAALVTAAAADNPDGPALVDRNRQVTWAELARECDEVAGGLAGLGMVASNRVAILLGNRIEFVTAYLGTLGSGLVAVPLNPHAATGEIVRVLADCSPKVVVCDRDTVTSTRAAVAGLAEALEGADEAVRARAVVPQVVVVDAPTLPGEHVYADLHTSGRSVAPPPQDPETLAVLLYTAGTSGNPRAAMLPHRALLANIEQAASLTPAPLDRADRVLGVLPMFHVYGLNAVLGQVLKQAACLVMSDRFDKEGTLALIEQESVTNAPIAPPAVAAWSHRDDLGDRLTGVRTVLSGASPLPPQVVRRFEERSGITVHQGYGLTEAAPVVTSTLGAPEPPKSGSVGRPLPGVEIRVVDESGSDTDGHDPGEILVRGANLFCGYWPDGGGGHDGEGWYATGDVGYVDGDGDLFLVDRLREIVIVSGFNVYPVEVEEAVAEVDGVGEVAVIGTPDEEASTEVVVAYVVPDETSATPVEHLAEAVRAHCGTRLAPFKQPRHVHVVDRLPRSVSGKVAKGRLRDSERRRAMGFS
ncbi:MAG: class I adenylate-forming enzyme family protein [Nocardioidaceae bacterium]